MSTVVGIIVGILILSVMMIVHELGHFLTGRRLGFKIEEFSIFMGPVLFSWTRKDVKYSIKAFPIGASVRFAGEFMEDGTMSDDPSHFYNRPKWARAIVLVTGPLLNLLSGVMALLILFTAFGCAIPVQQEYDSYAGTQAYEAGILPGERIVSIEGEAVNTWIDLNGGLSFIGNDKTIAMQVRALDGTVRNVVLQPVKTTGYRLGINLSGDTSKGIIGDVEATSNGGSPVLKKGDQLLAINGQAYNYDTLPAIIRESAGETFEVTVLREGKTLDLQMVATSYEFFNSRGINPQTSQEFLTNVGQSFMSTWSIVKFTVRSIGMMFTGQIKAEDSLSGPVGIVTFVSDIVAQQQPLSDLIYQLLWIIALISVSLGFMNLLPIPPLDGNHLLLIGIEAIRGKRLTEKVQNMIGVFGFALIILLAITGLIFDIMRLVNR